MSARRAFVLPSKLRQFIRIRKKHYRYLKEKSVLSYWYLLYMRFDNSAVLSRMRHWNSLLENRYLLPEAMGAKPITLDCLRNPGHLVDAFHYRRGGKYVKQTS